MEIKICENIKRLRSQLGVTQEMLADYCGISSQAVSKWEMQQSLPDISVLPSIAEYFKVSMDALFFGDNGLTRRNMVNAARTGMKSAKVILVKLMADSVKGFMYHQEKYNELFTSDSQMVIVQNIVYKGVSLGEGFDYVIELSE